MRDLKQCGFDLIGRRFKTNARDYGEKGYKPVEFVITAVYPYYVEAVRYGTDTKECFNIGELIQLGLIRQDDRMESYKRRRSQYEVWHEGEDE